MKFILFVLFMLSSSLNPILSQPNLLERAKNNPSEGSKLCKKFKEINSTNESATSDDAIEFVTKKNNLSMVNAEFYSIYVIGLYCPEIY